MIKIYTRTGDLGETGLFGTTRVSKDDHRVEAYGTVDELNAVIGLARLHTSADIFADIFADMDALLQLIQQDLFTLGSDLATPIEDQTTRGRVQITRVSTDQVLVLEQQIDRYQEELPPLTRFILPGGSALAASLHHARVVCRRAERRTVTLANSNSTDNSSINADNHSADNFLVNSGSINTETIRYLNRLSDLLFVLARIANHRQQIPDVLWNS